MTDEEERRKERREVLTTAPVKKLILKLAFPTIVSMLVTALYNMADTFFAGQIGKSATAAVGVVFSLMTVLQAAGFFFGHGSGNYISRKLGAGDEAGAAKMASVGFWSAFIAGAVIAAACFFAANPLARLLGAIPSVLPEAVSYMRIVIIGTPFLMSSLVLNNQLRLQGNALYAMFGIGAGAVLNIALDPLFIFVFGMGIEGAAVATVLSQIVSFAVLIFCRRKSASVSVNLKNFKPSLEKYRAILQGGLPSLCRQGLQSVAAVLLNRAVGGYGEAAIAAMSIALRVTNFAYSALLGFGQGFQPVCGFGYGAGLKSRVKEACGFCVKVTSVACAVFAAVMCIFAPQIVSAFCKGDAEVVRAGAAAMRWQCASFPLLGFVVISNMLLQNMNKFRRASLTAAARQGLFFVPLILVFPRFMSLTGVFIAQPVSDALTFVLTLPIIIITFKRELS